jgi:hypothetical protein
MVVAILQDLAPRNLDGKARIVLLVWMALWWRYPADMLQLTKVCLLGLPVLPIVYPTGFWHLSRYPE